MFISSAASLRAATGIPAYDASKAALAGLCRQVAREGMARGLLSGESSYVNSHPLVLDGGATSFG